MISQIPRYLGLFNFDHFLNCNMTSSLRLVKVLPNWYYMGLNLTSATTSLHYNHNYTSEVVRPSASGLATSYFTLLATKCINQ